MGKSKKHKNLPTQKNKTNSSKMTAEARQVQFQGPIPPPEILSNYEQLQPGAADRILAMAESETRHRQEMERMALTAEVKGLTSEAKDTQRGQYCGLTIGIVAILSGTYAAVNGAPWAGGFIGTGGVVALVSAFYWRTENYPERQWGQPFQRNRKGSQLGLFVLDTGNV